MNVAGVTAEMRKDLVEWMLEVNDQYQLSCLSLAVNYVDRFLSRKLVAPNQVQCLGYVSNLFCLYFIIYFYNL